MSRKFTEGKLVLATHNRGRLAAFRGMMNLPGVELVSAGDLGIEEPVEDGTTFFENCLIKAKAVSEASGLPCMADDSGLCVKALNSDPGVYSADWAGTPRDFKAAMQMVHDKMGDATDKGGAFVSTLILMWPDGHYESVEGRIEGTLVWPPRGGEGFGYDPMFQPEGESKTFGEMTMEEKKNFSHRARAFKALKAKVF